MPRAFCSRCGKPDDGCMVFGGNKPSEQIAFCPDCGGPATMELFTLKPAEGVSKQWIKALEELKQEAVSE